MNWAVWVSFVVVAGANIVTPGPAILNTVRRAIQLGIGQVGPTIAGNALGLAVAGFLCAVGVANLVVASPSLWMLSRWLGVGYLGWLGLKLIMKDETLSTSTEARQGVPASALFREAFLLAVSNPKALLFFVALFPQVISPDAPVLTQSLTLVATYSGLSVLSLSCYSLLATLARERFFNQTRYSWFRRISGCVLLAFAAKLALDVS